jgi:hypothetical protein
LVIVVVLDTFNFEVIQFGELDVQLKEFVETKVLLNKKHPILRDLEFGRAFVIIKRVPKAPNKKAFEG